MKTVQKTLLFALLGALLVGATACSDPRRNCNHPDHEEYIREGRLKGKGH